MTAARTIMMAALAAALQIGFLGWTIASRASALRSGQEVMLKIEPVDPRDLLRGDYVTMSYDASRIPTRLLIKPYDDKGRDYDKPVWVRLEKGQDRYWVPVAASIGEPLPGPPAAGQVDLKARNPYLAFDPAGGQDTSIAVNFGIERYYVPEGEGREIEKGIGARPFGVLAVVTADGSPQIKALYDGDTALYEEPWY